MISVSSLVRHLGSSSRSKIDRRIARVLSGATIDVSSAPVKVSNTNAGKATTAATGNHVHGVALTSAASGEYLDVLLGIGGAPLP